VESQSASPGGRRRARRGRGRSQIPSQRLPPTAPQPCPVPRHVSLPDVALTQAAAAAPLAWPSTIPAAGWPMIARRGLAHTIMLPGMAPLRSGATTPPLFYHPHPALHWQASRTLAPSAAAGRPEHGGPGSSGSSGSSSLSSSVRLAQAGTNVPVLSIDPHSVTRSWSTSPLLQAWYASPPSLSPAPTRPPPSRPHQLP
jgi:hypothetical protein